MVYRNISREEFEERISFFNDYCELLLKSLSVKKFGFKILDKRLEKDPKSFSEHFILNVIKEFPESNVEEIFDIRDRIEDCFPGDNSPFVRVNTFLVSTRYSPFDDSCEEHIIYIKTDYSRPHELKTSVKLRGCIKLAGVTFKIVKDGCVQDAAYFNAYLKNKQDPNLARLSRNVDELKECFKQERVFKKTLPKDCFIPI